MNVPLSYPSDGPISVSSDPQEAKQSSEEATRLMYQNVATSNVLSDNVIPNLRVLLAEVLRAINVSIPNKDQNRSVTEIIRAAFDRAYFDINTRAFPDTGYSQGPGYALSPEPDRYKAFSHCTLAGS